MRGRVGRETRPSCPRLFLPKGDVMIVKSSVIVLLAFASALSVAANDKKHKDFQRGMLEKMEAVPCGAKQRGLSGLGTLWASAGVTHVNTDEKLCPQYLLRTDKMDYEIRPLDLKHAVLLPVGTEGEFKMKDKDILLTMPEGGDRKTRSYEVVSMNPAPAAESSAHPADDGSVRPADDRGSSDRASTDDRSSDRSSPNASSNER